MYFWNTQQLINDLRQDHLTEADFKNYYLAAGILMLVTILLSNYAPMSSHWMAWAYFVCGIGLLISWVNLIFKANGGVEGQQFLNRFVALYVPITIKMLVVSIGLTALIETMWMIFVPNALEQDPTTWINQWRWFVMDQVILCLTYWRIYVAMKKIHS